MRTIAFGLGSALIIGISNAQAMGLGEMTVRSYLNQPLVAEIPLVDVSPNELESIRVRFANAQAFERQGYSLGAVSGRIQVQLQGGKQPRVRLTSKSSIHEPVLGLVLELEGPDGTIQRSYDILLDPVNYHIFTPSPDARASGQPAESLRLVPDVAHPLQGHVENGHYQVREGETLWRIAYNLRPQGMTTEQMMYALRRMNPKAFAKDGAILRGAKLRVPESDEVLRLWAGRKVAAEKASTPIKQAQAAQPAASAKTEKPSPSPSNQPGDDAKLTIVAPAQGAAPVVAAPVVGEVMGSSVVEPQPTREDALVIQLQEQLEAAKASNEQLQERLNSAEERLQKMEELVRLKDEQIKQLEKQPPAAAPKVEKQPSAASQPPQTEGPRKEEEPTEEGGLLDVLGQPALLGGLILAGMLLALVILRLRRRRDEARVPGAPVVQPEASAPVTEVAPMHAVAGTAMAGGSVAGAVVGDAVAETPGGEESPVGAVTDSVESVLEEVDVMQVYGLHDRARQVLEEAIERMPKADALQARRIRLFHEMGLKDEFLRAAREYRTTHPAEDDPHWAAIQAIGVKSYADEPLFGGSGVVQPEPSGELAAMSVNEAQAAPQLHTPFVQPEVVTKTEPASAIHRSELTLEWPPASAPGAFGAPEQSTQPESIHEPLAFGAPEQPAQPESIHELLAFGAPKQPDPSELDLEPLSLELPALELGDDLGETKEETKAPRAVEPEPLPVFDLQALSLEPAVTEVPSPAPVAGETPVLPVVASPEVLPMPAAEAPVMAGVAAEGAISEDDLMLLGLDEASIDAQPLDLAGLLASEEPQELAPRREEALVAPKGDASVSPVAMPAASFLPASEEPPTVRPLPVEELAAPTGDAPATPVAMPAASFDERAVKLDMAQALVDLGDLDGARGMLEEIISTRDDELSERAREMLERIAD